MRKAIFLDRDGVLIDNQQHYYIWKSDQMKFVDGVFKNLQLLLENGFQLFIVSNQGGISRGLYSKEDILKLHDEMIEIFRNNKITITEILFCPHHGDNEKCLCRKPEPLMIEKLIAKYGISPSESVMIGDSDPDMQAAAGAGIRGIKIMANQNMLPFILELIQ